MLRVLVTIACSVTVVDACTVNGGAVEVVVMVAGVALVAVVVEV